MARIQFLESARRRLSRVAAVPQSGRRLSLAVVAVATMVFATGGSLTGAALAAPAAAGTAVSQPDFGPNVKIFDPSMSTSQIQATVDAIAAQQVDNQFGPQRYALLFKPGVYGSATDPLNFQVGYYTAVAGLGLSPTDVVINGSVYVRNQCDASGSCVALNNFWRSLSNLTINVTNPSFGCYTGEFWAVSQASPMRRVNVTGGNVTLMDYCSGPSFASGGFIADSQFAGGTVINGSQQQWLVRNSVLDGWTNGVWNQVFSGVVRAPAECFPASASCGERVRGAQDARAREPAQPAHDLPGPDQRQGRDPERRQRCRGLVDHRQPVSCRHGGQLPGGVTVGSSVLKRYEFSPRAVQVLSRRGSPSSGC